MARLLVGLPALQGDIQKYRDRFDLVEVRPIDTSLPRQTTLRKWRRSVPPGFVFSVVLPRAVGELAAGEELDAALASSLEVASILEARCVLLQTPPSLRPTAANRRKIAALFERIPAEGVVRCWEASGLWEREDVIATARAAGAIAVLDAAREALPPGPIAYTRLRALGSSASLGAGTIEKVAEQLRGRREAFVVVEGPGAARAKAALVGAMAQSRARPAGPATVRPAAPSTLIAEDE
ncbi:MAG: DUF72 domain-containing protein, partial [Polyangiaceae bacterium]|nr:DUF72 domain-containing protein [Polyangiaceae bacterium]